MTIRKLSSHFILLPNGKVKQWPLVECDNMGTILNISYHPGDLKERQGLEFHSGIMIPGLIDIAYTNEAVIIDDRLLNRHFSFGTLVFGLPKPEAFHRQGLPLISNNSTAVKSPYNFLERNKESISVPLFKRIVDSQAIPLKELGKSIEWSASHTEYPTMLGSLEKGKTPGILILKQYDTERQLVMNESTVQWLVKPELKFIR